MSAGFETTDTLHYHSRAIRDGLKASINRLAHAKAHIPLPEFAASNTQNNIQQDWTAPASMDFDKASLIWRTLPPMASCMALCITSISYAW